MWKRFAKWCEKRLDSILPKEYGLDEVLTASTKFQAGKEYTFLLKRDPSWDELTTLLHNLHSNRRDLTMLVERNGVMLTILVNTSA